MPDLTVYNQQQVLKYFDELNNIDKNILLNQINSINFEFMNTLYKNSFTDEIVDLNNISSLNIIDSLDVKENPECINIGEELVKNNEYAVLLMAGGFGSRLGLDIPKGCLELNIKGKKISLFEFFINQLKLANEKHNSLIKLYIMTGDNNYKDIISYFEDNNYFNYPKECVKIFVQGKLPILDVNGKIVLKGKNEILFGPNGNGDVFRALKENNLIEDMKENNIKYILFSTIDNVLNNLVDYSFIGATIKNNYKLSSKTITKESENEKDWIFCKYMNKPYMLQTHCLTPEITNYKDENGNYLYREKNITYHLISLDLVELFSEKQLKYHRAYKKNNYLDENGKLIIAEENNSFKFEKFIFDAFEYADDMLLYRISKDEFMPIKKAEDIKKIEDYLNNN